MQLDANSQNNSKRQFKMGLERREAKDILNVISISSKKQKNRIEGKTRANSKDRNILKTKLAFEAIADAASHFPDKWWQDNNHPERQKLLTVIGEFDGDSEDEMGKAKYIKAKCPQYK